VSEHRSDALDAGSAGQELYTAALAARVTPQMLRRANAASIDGNADARAAGRPVRVEHVFLAIVKVLAHEVDQATLIAIVLRLQALAHAAGGRDLDHWAMEVTGRSYVLVEGAALVAASQAKLTMVDGRPRFDPEELRSLALAAATARGAS